MCRYLCINIDLLVENLKGEEPAKQSMGEESLEVMASLFGPGKFKNESPE